MKGHHLIECPFCHGHECFSIQPEKGLYHCFQCPGDSAGGDVFRFLERYHGMSPGEALKKAAEMAGIKLQGGSTRKAVEITVHERIFAEAALYYHGHMLDNGGRDYFIARRGHREETLKKMRVGWAPGGLTDYLRSKGYTEEEMTSSGLVKNRGGRLRDFFGPELAIFPHLDGDAVLHFTMKDPLKKVAYQLPNSARSKDWRFYNQAALRHNEIIVVEGENDLLSVMDAGIKHVIGLIGQVSESQLKTLRSEAKAKHLYLWLDRDSGGEAFIEKIHEALRGQEYHVRIIVHPGDAKDPDEYLRGFTGDRHKEIQRLQNEAVDFISWDIGRVELKHKALDDKLRALKDRKIFSAVANMVLAEQEAFIEKLVALGFSRKAIEEQLEVNMELRDEIGLYIEACSGIKNADPNRIASIIFRHFNQHGRFFRDSGENVYLLYQHTIYYIGNNRPFNALMKKSTGLLPTKEPGRSLWEALASDAYNSGTHIDLASWINTDRASDTIYVNLNCPNNNILKLSAQGIEEVPNGLNRESVLLKSSRKILPLNFRPDVSIREGMEALRDIVFKNLTCELEQRYLIICWLMSAFLLDFSQYMALMKFSGASASGKTTAARLLSLLMYGTDYLGDPSAAAAYAVASQNPLLVIDNLEHEDITKSLHKFLLLSATKGGKEKRAGGTDTDTIEEKPKALILVTAIEPFVKAELINRTYDVEFLSRFKEDDFIEDEVVRALAKQRDIILSSILKFIHKEVLPNLHQRKDYITVLKKEYRGHAKSRTDEYLALLMLLLKYLLPHIPRYDEDDFLSGTEEPEICRAWVQYQDSKAKDTETSSNSILKLLDGLVREYLLAFRLSKPEPVMGSFYGYDEDVFVHQHPMYHIEMIKTQGEQINIEGENYRRAYVEFMATSQEICSAFDVYCRNTGIRNPFTTASVFASRLKNDRELLRKGGWELISRPGSEPHFRKVHGHRYWKFRKELIQ